MEITRSSTEGRVRLALTGRLDATWSGHVQRALAECIRDGEHDIELDLRQVPFLSSAGIRVLLVAHRQLHGIQGRLAIVDASDEVRQVVELAGLRALLETTTRGVEAPDRAEAATPELLERHGARFEVQARRDGAAMAVRAIGDPGALRAGGAGNLVLTPTRFPPSSLAVAIGAFGADGGTERLGELLAAGGAALTWPGTADGTPDWLVAQDRFVPEAQLAYGLVAEGVPAVEASFHGEAGAPLALSALVETALELAQAPAIAFAAVAEVAQIVGARLRRPPADRGDAAFVFPAIRDHLDFTAEPAHAGSTAVLVGFAARAPAPPLDRHLRPIAPEATGHAHVHAAVFPYRPVQRGRIDLAATVQRLLDAQTVTAVLHLLNDWRPGTGAGETALFRGALWCGPVALPVQDAPR